MNLMPTKTQRCLCLSQLGPALVTLWGRQEPGEATFTFSNRPPGSGSRAQAREPVPPTLPLLGYRLRYEEWPSQGRGLG